ncbi:hypothetical protein NDA12_005995 [Ustilago hordei]|nr:hypothetical protein NDA15_000036 [Ustilago hordei]KAJ1588295.1 hypothetical protein NDA12_005995 [Ustilago hordei]
MRFARPSTFLLLSFVVSVVSSWQVISCAPGATCRAIQQPQLIRRQELQAATSWAKAEVPDRFKNWKIFQDGSRVREGIRKGYVGVLRQVDKMRQPYPEWKYIKKKWIYEPDLRKQYVLPRVLRVPAILQETPVPNLKQFVSAVKSSEPDSGLKALARAHVPGLSQELGKDGTKTPVKVKTDASPSKEENSRRAIRERRRSSYTRKKSFNDFKASQPNRRPPPPRTPVPEIESDQGMPSGQASPSRDGVSVIEAASRAEPLMETVEQKSQKEPPNADVKSFLIESNDKYQQIMKFKEEQIRRAASRYIGYPEPALTASTKAKQGVVAEGTGLSPLRLKKEGSQEISPDPTPRQFDDLTAMDADVSNPQTPQATISSFSSSHFPGTPYTPAGSFRSPHDVAPDPLPVESWTSNIPKTAGNMESNTPGSFRLPADYTDILHRARFRPNVQRLPNDLHVFTDPIGQQIDPAKSASVSAGWEGGRPTNEGIRKVQEIAELNDAGYAIYNEDPALGQTGKAQFVRGQSAKIRPSSSDDQNDLQTPTTQSQDALNAKKDWETGPRGETLFTVTQARQRPIFDMSSFTESPRLSDVHSQPPTSIRGSIAAQRSNDEVVQAGNNRALEPTSPEAPPRKRKRPDRLDEADQNTFNFPPPKLDLASPKLKGFKPALRIKEAPNIHYDPSVNPNDSRGVVLNRASMAQLLRSPSQRVRDVYRRLMNLSPTSSRGKIIKTFKEMRKHPPRRQDDAGELKDAT